MRIQISYDLLDHNYAAGEKDAFWQEIEAILARKKGDDNTELQFTRFQLNAGNLLTSTKRKQVFFLSCSEYVSPRAIIMALGIT